MTEDSRAVEYGKPAGQKPNAAAKRINLRDSDPQAYEAFLGELREACRLPPHAGKTLEEVIRTFEKQAHKPVVWLGDLLETILGTPRNGVQVTYGSWERAVGAAEDRILEWRTQKVRMRDPLPPPTYEAFLAELREALGVSPNAGKTIEEVLDSAEYRPLTETPQQSHPANGFLEKLLAQSDLSGPSAFEILGACMELAVFLIDKNRQYGDSALDPIRIMSSADPVEQIKVRMDDKLTRLYRGQAGGEDAMKDLVGYWILLRVAQKEA